MRKARIIIYDSDDEEKLNQQLEKSLPIGLHHLAVDITIMPIDETLPKLYKMIQNLVIGPSYGPLDLSKLK